jgi:hypothetical protein
MRGPYDRSTPHLPSATGLIARGEAVTGDRVSRPRLAGRVGDALGVGDVLLIAGAGYGKTSILEESMSGVSSPVAWINCSVTERASGVLLLRILDEIARVAPGASNALAERLAAAPEQVDVFAATRELLAELPRLLVEPLVLVVDDGEHLDGADGALRLLGELIRAQTPSLHVAVASRRPLELRVAKPRAAGRLREFIASDLAFDAAECAAVLRARHGVEPSPERVDGLMRATEGWPLGIGLAVAVVAGAELRHGDQAELRELRSAPELRSFLSEELFDSLDADLRQVAVESSVARVVTPAVAAALALPPDFRSRIERAGMLIRQVGGEGGFAYHPLLREFLLERLGTDRGEAEQQRLHGLVAPAIAQDGDPIEAIEHLLAARSWTEAVSAIEREGPGLVRKSAGLMRHWLSLLPAEARALPTMLALEGQLDWGAGDHPRAAAVLRNAVRGFREHPNPPFEWLARFALADSIFATFEFDELSQVVEGWDDAAAGPAGILAPATVAYVSVTLAMLGRIEESDRLARQALQHPAAGLLGPVEALRVSYRDTPRGHLDEVLAQMKAAVAQLQVSDPFNRRLYFLATLAMMYSERGYPEEALKVWTQVREGGIGGSVPILTDSARAWCALLYTTLGRVHEAETELALHEGQEKGWRDVLITGLAAACVAALQGDAAATVASADQTLAVAVRGPVIFFHRTATQLIPPLVAVGRPDRAREVLQQTFSMVDDVYPGALGLFLRGRLLALRAWLRHTAGDSDGSDADLLRFWEEAGETLPHILRREWERLEAVVSAALERGVLEPERTVAALRTAFPEGLQLVAFLQHPVAAMRRAVLEPATASGDPEALVQLRKLAADPDPEMAAAASRAVRRLAHILPPLHFELLGPVRCAPGLMARGRWMGPPGGRTPRALPARQPGPVGARGPDLRGAVAGTSGGRRSQQPAGGDLQGSARARRARSGTERHRKRRTQLPSDPC